MKVHSRAVSGVTILGKDGRITVDKDLAARQQLICVVISGGREAIHSSCALAIPQVPNWEGDDRLCRTEMVLSVKLIVPTYSPAIECDSLKAVARFRLAELLPPGRLAMPLGLLPGPGSKA